MFTQWEIRVLTRSGLNVILLVYLLPPAPPPPDLSALLQTATLPPSFMLSFNSVAIMTSSLALACLWI